MPSVNDDLFYALDPGIWCREVLDLQPDSWQQAVLRSNSNRMLLCCSRQSGKSTITSALALHTAIYRPSSLILCLSPTLRQSSELFRNVTRFYQRIGNEIPSTAESALRLELVNRSRIVALPGQEQTIRGMANVALMICDEAARIEDPLYYSVRPMLAVSQGRMIALSTPFGRRGWFFHEWEDGQGWERHQVTALQCPRISAEFLEEERRSMPTSWFVSEYMCEFVETVDSVFSYDQVMGAISPDVEPLDFGGEA
jgi:hypothetical protein